jgi:hypothetical protein
MHPAAGLAVAGVVVTGLSLVAQRQPKVKDRHLKAVEDEPLPGPADRGNLHVMGR